MTRSVRLILFAAVALYLPHLRTQEPPPTPPVEPARPPVPLPRDARITGTVLCADTHRFARGASVIATPIPAANGATPGDGGIPGMGRVASDGTYLLRNLAP